MADLNVSYCTFVECDSAEIDRQMRQESGIFGASPSGGQTMPRIASTFDQDLIVLVCAEAISLMSAAPELANPVHAELAAPRDRFLALAPENLTD